tara:strand:- start:607 stop:885 length:279 start_codon:yes stop_codon:yes gene_type:complete
MVININTFKTLSNVPTWDTLKMATIQRGSQIAYPRICLTLLTMRTKQEHLGYASLHQFCMGRVYFSNVSRETMASDTLTVAIIRKKLAISSV